MLNKKDLISMYFRKTKCIIHIILTVSNLNYFDNQRPVEQYIGFFLRHC